MSCNIRLKSAASRAYMNKEDVDKLKSNNELIRQKQKQLKNIQDEIDRMVKKSASEQVIENLYIDYQNIEHEIHELEKDVTKIENPFAYYKEMTRTLLDRRLQELKDTNKSIDELENLLKLEKNKNIENTDNYKNLIKKKSQILADIKTIKDNIEKLDNKPTQMMVELFKTNMTDNIRILHNLLNSFDSDNIELAGKIITYYTNLLANPDLQDYLKPEKSSDKDSVPDEEAVEDMNKFLKQFRSQIASLQANWENTTRDYISNLAVDLYTIEKLEDNYLYEIERDTPTELEKKKELLAQARAKGIAKGGNGDEEVMAILYGHFFEGGASNPKFDINKIDEWLGSAISNFANNNQLPINMLFYLIEFNKMKAYRKYNDFSTKLEQQKKSVQQEMKNLGLVKDGKINWRFFATPEGGIRQRFHWDKIKIIKDSTEYEEGDNESKITEKNKKFYNNFFIVEPTDIIELLDNTEFESLFSQEDLKNKQKAIDFKEKFIKEYGEKQYQEIVIDYTNKLHTLNIIKESKNEELIKSVNPFDNKIKLDDFRKKRYINHNKIVVPRKFNLETQQKTGFYDENFPIIENNEILSNFYELIEEYKEYQDHLLTPSQLREMGQKRLGAIDMVETNLISTGLGVFDKNSWKNSMSKWKNKAVKWVSKGTEKGSGKKVDVLTGEATDEVLSNYKFTNQKLIDDIEFISKRDFIEVSKIPQNFLSNQKIKSLNDSAVALVLKYLNISSNITDGRKAIMNELGSDSININSIIKKYAQRTVFEEENFDLIDSMKYYYGILADYESRVKSLSAGIMLKRIQHSYTKKSTKNTFLNRITGEKQHEGELTNSNQQFDYFYNKKLLGILSPSKSLSNDKEGYYTEYAKNIRDYVDNKLKEDDELKKNSPNKDVGLSQQEREKLIAFKEENLEIQTPFRKVWNGLRNFFIWKSMAYNVMSMVPNFYDGQIQNIMLAVKDGYFTSEDYAKYGAIAQRNLVTPGITKYDIAINKYMLTFDFFKSMEMQGRANSIMDKVNNLNNPVNPWWYNKTTEKANQNPVSMTLLGIQKIKDINGKEHSLLDAMDNEWKLKPEFRDRNNKFTKDNVATWEEMSTPEFNRFRMKVISALNTTAGNYYEGLGMKLQDYDFGKALLTFKRYMVMHFINEWQIEKFNMATGQREKGHLRSLNMFDSALMGIVSTALTANPLLMLGAGGLGAIISHFGSNQYHQNKEDFFKKSFYSTSQLIKTFASTPINMVGKLMGKQFIKNEKAYENWVNKYGFKQVDAQNMRANMIKMANRLWISLLIVIAKAYLFDSDDNKDSKKRVAHNVIVNQLTGLLNDLDMTVNIVGLFKDNSLGSPLIMGMFQKAEKVNEDVGKYLSTGIDFNEKTGGSQIMLDISKTATPTIFTNIFLYGQINPISQPFMERELEKKGINEYFKSEHTKAQEVLRIEKKKYKIELQERFPDYDDKKLRKEINKKFKRENEKMKKWQKQVDIEHGRKSSSD